MNELELRRCRVVLWGVEGERRFGLELRVARDGRLLPALVLQLESGSYELALQNLGSAEGGESFPVWQLHALLASLLEKGDAFEDVLQREGFLRLQLESCQEEGSKQAVLLEGLTSVLRQRDTELTELRASLASLKEAYSRLQDAYLSDPYEGKVRVERADETAR